MDGRHVDGDRTFASGNIRCPTMQRDARLPASSDLDFGPREVHTRPERLPYGLLRRKAPCVALCGPRLAIELFHLSGRKTARTEAFWVSQECPLHPLDLDQVKPNEQTGRI